MTDREKLIKLLCEANSKSVDAELFEDSCYAQQLEIEADYLIANGVTFAKDTNVPSKGHWIIHHEGGNNWCECSECNTVGSPFWKRCPVCEAKMEIEAPKQEKSCINCENDGFDIPQCKDCNPYNGFAYHRKKV